MFYYVEGILACTEPYLAVIDCGGVGYACHTTLTTLARVEKGEKTRLYTYLHIREEIFDLYGFSDLEELNCFKMLIGISGVGPRAAISILSSATPERLALAVITGDEKALTAAPGIGKKLASRIILELKDKMTREQLAASAGAANLAQPMDAGRAAEAAAALGVLGYSQTEAAMALKGLDAENLPVEELVRQALRRMAAAK
jgi:Holliday junction DNA helicase RuvA